jgi:hypothetical protein
MTTSTTAALDTRPRRRAQTTAAPFVAAGAWYAIFIARASFRLRGQRTFTLFDDAMISMTYARNLAHGHGLVWNAGSHPVEGITNLLWTLVMVVPHALGFGDRWAPLVVQLLGVAILFACAAAARAVVRLAAPDAPNAQTIVTWSVLFCYPLVYWTLRGMKWDYEISILGDRPDLVAGLWRPTPDDRERIAGAGYEVVQLRREVAQQLDVDYERQTRFLARRDSAAVDWAALEVVDD